MYRPYSLIFCHLGRYTPIFSHNFLNLDTQKGGTVIFWGVVPPLYAFFWLPWPILYRPFWWHNFSFINFEKCTALLSAILYRPKCPYKNEKIWNIKSCTALSPYTLYSTALSDNIRTLYRPFWNIVLFTVSMYRPSRHSLIKGRYRVWRRAYIWGA